MFWRKKTTLDQAISKGRSMESECQRLRVENLALLERWKTRGQADKAILECMKVVQHLKYNPYRHEMAVSCEVLEARNLLDVVRNAKGGQL